MKKTVMIKKNYEFQYFFKKGNYYSGKFIEIFIHKNNYDNNKLGIVVSKKVGKSVIRNNIKRLIRESYSKLEDNIDSCNIIIAWKKTSNVENASYNNVLNDLYYLFKKARVLINEENIDFVNKNI